MIAEAYRRIGLPPHSTMHGAFLDLAVFSRDEEIRRISKQRMEQSMKLAAGIGAEGVVFHTNYNPLVPGAAYKDYLVKATAEYTAWLLEKYPHQRIYMENMFDVSPDVLEGVSRQLKGYANYGVCLDWAHVNVYGSDREEWIEPLVPYIRHIHINDNDLKTDLHLAVGEGSIDWEYFFDKYQKFLADCSVLIETNDPGKQRKSLEYIRSRFQCI